HPSIVEASIQKRNIEHKVILQNSLEQKQFVLDNKKTNASTLQKNFHSVLFSPESLSVIKNSDLERRDLVDELILSLFPEQTSILNDYKKSLRQRNKFLKDISSGALAKDSRNILYYETLTQTLLKLASQIAVLRMEALEKILTELKSALHSIFETSSVDISVDYVISDVKQIEKDANSLYSAMYNRWMQLSSAELSVGHSLVGSHKHDICVLFNGKDSRYYCSQGQQRLLILAFKMAQIRVHYEVHGIYPVLLLDDVLSEIDEQKRVKLIEYLETLDAQIFLTSTENTVLNYLSRDHLSVFKVVNGNIRNYVSDLVGDQGGESVRQFDHSRESEEL
ncbi:MAG: DNA replication and repair protein RecF, partial [Bdellovibrionaceae bacterium]|nr:DNA replication and repair protein RecF [Pseudobdellovibrionaceae bacterium]